jgi:arylsulfatase A
MQINNFVRNGKKVEKMSGPSSHVVVDEATQWLDQQQAGGEKAPFYLNLWFHENHEPVAAGEDYLALYPDEDNSDLRHYRGDVSQMDAAVGTLMAYLDAHHLRDNTIIFFTSDNGPETLNRYKTANRSYGTPGPLRGMKLHVTEAGYRVPGIVRWPGHVNAGTVSDVPVSTLDFLPTACALAGIEPPQDRSLDGANMLPLFAGEPIVRPHPLYWQYDRAISPPWHVAIRDGAWKLVANATLDTFALYQLDEDIAEQKDRASEQPARVQEMAAIMKRLHAEVASDAQKSGNPIKAASSKK